MTRHSKRQRVLPVSATSLTGKRTRQNDHSIAEHLPTINDLNRQRLITLVQDDQCIVDARSDGTITTTQLKSYSLPNEIMALVLDHITDSQATLYQCTLVSKQCYAFANPLLWKAPVYSSKTISNLQDCLNRMPLKRRRALGHHIETLNLHGRWFAVKQLIPYMPCLKHFMMDGTFIKMLAKDVALLRKHCPALTSIRLDHVHLTKSSFGHLAKHGQLTEFEWKMTDQQDPLYLSHLKGCPLRRLSISSDDRPFEPPMLDTILAFDQLTCLEVNTFYMFPDNLLRPTAFPRLTILHLYACNNLSNPALVAFLQTHPHLEQLYLRSAFKLTDSTLDAMHFLPLTHLAITYNRHITAPAVRRLINACPPLTRVDLSCCKLTPSDFPEHRYEIYEILSNKCKRIRWALIL